MKQYTSTGLVYGNYWGGGRGAYKAEPLSADSREQLLEKAKEGIVEGWLDKGMGFESLLGAVLNVVETEMVTKNGKEYSRSELEVELVGDLDENEQDFLLRALDSC